jgi:16S rRNA pseudouridine516 synthase
MRLDKYIASGTGLTRTQAKRAISRGRVTLDNREVRDSALQVVAGDTVRLGDDLVGLRQPVYLMLNKPAGYICATEDGEHPTVLDLLGSLATSGLHPAGRLDRDTTGLVLITDDGQWSHRVTAPKRTCLKTYRVTLADDVDTRAIEWFRQGVQLKGEIRLTRPAELDIITTRKVLLRISEGRYHQVKRMFAATGNRVTALHREQIGPLRLDVDLAPGEYRPLTPSEISSF